MLTSQVKIEITKKLKGCRQDLQALGTSRQTSAQQSQYLMEAAMQFQKLSGEALLSNYGCTDVFDQNPTLRLATAVVNRSKQMSDIIATKGHTFHFEAGDEDELEASDDVDSLVVDISAMDIEDGNVEGVVDTRTIKDHPELEDLVSAAQKLPEPRSGRFRAWLTHVYRNSRGFEIGTLNFSLLAVTMKHQSVKWKKLALGYISDIITMVHNFIVDLLRVVCPFERVRTGIMSLLMDRLLEKYQSAISQVKFLMEVELDGTPATLNHYFNENLEKW